MDPKCEKKASDLDMMAHGEIGDCPPLVSSDEEEPELDLDTDIDDAIELWTGMVKRLGREKVEYHVGRIMTQTLGLFALGLQTLVPPGWNRPLLQTGLLPSDGQSSDGELTERHLSQCEVMELICKQAKEPLLQTCDSRHTLRGMLKMIEHIEKKASQTGMVGVTEALEEAVKWPNFQDGWAVWSTDEKVTRFLRNHCDGLHKPVSLCVVLCYKMVYMHVIYFSTFASFKADQIDKNLHNKYGLHCNCAKEQGDKFFKEGKYSEAIKMYSHALILHYSSEILYRNRAQCYIFLRDYWKAYCDIRRAMFVNPQNTQMCYEAAECCIILGRLADAVTMNHLFADFCSREKNPQLEEACVKQKDRICAALECTGDEDDLEEGLNRLDSLGEMQIALNIQRNVAALVTLRPWEQTPPDTSTQGVCSTPVSNSGNSRNNSESKISADRKNSCESNGSNDGNDKPQEPGSSEESRKFGLYLKEGLEAYNLDNFVRASGKYQAALNLWNQTPSLKSSVQPSQMTVVRYAFGVTSICVDEVKSLIQEGLKSLQALCKEVTFEDFPLIAYGMARALTVLYRFPEARAYAERRVTKKMVKDWRSVCWPGSSQPIEESRLDVFRREMDKLQKWCRFPPPPDAVCHRHVDGEVEDRTIYTASPTYAGMVTISCYDRCSLSFHIHCWKEYKDTLSADKISEKELLDCACPTPDCGSFVFYIRKVQPGKRTHEFKSEQQPLKPVKERRAAKMVPSNPCKVARRQERKEVRRQKKAEAQAGRGGETTPSDEDRIDDLAEGFSTSAPAARCEDVPLTVLQKEDTEDSKYNVFHKQVRQKKKKAAKGHNYLSLDFSFANDGDREAIRVGEQDVDDDPILPTPTPITAPRPSEPAGHQSRTAAPSAHFLPVPLPRPQPVSFSDAVTSQPARNVHNDREIQKTLVGFFQDFLRESGPQHLDGEGIGSYLEAFPEEATRVIRQYGGLRSFFERNPEFVVVGNCVGVVVDTETVQRLSMGLVSPSLNYANPFSRGTSATTTSQGLVIKKGVVEGGDFANSGVYSRSDDYTKSGVYSEAWGSPSVWPGQSRKRLASESELNPAAQAFEPRQGPADADPWGEESDGELPSGDASTTAQQQASGATQLSRGIDALDTFDEGLSDADIDEALLQWSSGHCDLETEADLDPPGVNSGENLSQTSDASPCGSGSRSSPGVATYPPQQVALSLLFKEQGLPLPSRTQSPALSSDVAGRRASPVSNSSNFSSSPVPSSVSTDRGNTESPLAAKLTAGLDQLCGSPYTEGFESHTSDWVYGESSGTADAALSLVRDSGLPVQSPTNAGCIGNESEDENEAEKLGKTESGTSISTVGSQILSSTYALPMSSSSEVSSSSTVTTDFSSAFPSALFPSSTTDWLTAADTDGWASSKLALPSLTGTRTTVTDKGDNASSLPPFSAGDLFPSAPSPDFTTVPVSTSAFPRFTWLLGNNLSQQSTTWPVAAATMATGAEGEHGGKAEGGEMRSRGVQAGTETRSAGVETELTLRDVHSLLDVEGLRNLQQEGAALLKEVEGVREERDRALQERDVATQERDVATQERELATQERDRALQENGRLHSELNRTKDLYVEMEEKLLLDMQELEQQKEKSSKELLQRTSLLEEQLSQARKRALQAEVAIVEDKVASFKMQLRIKELEMKMCERDIHREMSKWQEDPGSQWSGAMVDEVSAFFRQVFAVWRGSLENALRQISGQKEQLMSGVPWSEVPPITNNCPPLPRMPSCLKARPDTGRIEFVPPQQQTGTNLPASQPSQSASALRQPSQSASALHQPSQSASALPLPSQSESVLHQSALQSSQSVAAPSSLGPPGLGRPNPLHRPPGSFKSAPAPLRPIGKLKGLSSAPLQRAGGQSTAAPLSSTPKPLSEAASSTTVDPSLVSSGSNPNASVAGASGRGSSFDRLVQVVQHSFPTSQREDIMRAVQEVRQAHNGTLSGKSLEFIVQLVTNRLLALGFPARAKNPAADLSGKSGRGGPGQSEAPPPMAPPPGISAAWSVEGVGEGADPCAICHEEMDMSPVQALKCGHVFHDHCIRLWFRQQTTCPKCRIHTPLLDDFPSLR